MSISYKTPFKLQSLVAGNNLAYTVPEFVVSQVRACTIHNPTATQKSIEVYILPESVIDPAAAYRIIKGTLFENGSYLCPELANHCLQKGDKVVFVGEGLNAVLSVLEQSQ